MTAEKTINAIKRYLHDIKGNAKQITSRLETLERRKRILGKNLRELKKAEEILVQSLIVLGNLRPFDEEMDNG